MRITLALALSSGLITATLPASASAQAGPDDQGQTCEQAAAIAEARYELPAGLLQAIGRVESGRRDPASGSVNAWPWTINAEGRGQWFPSPAAALAAVRNLQASGVSSIDVGCFQINLLYHPAAFSLPEDGFEPAKNADYAARLLLSLKGRYGNWDGAIAAYHSANPERGTPYRDKVMAGLVRQGGAPPNDTATFSGLAVGAKPAQEKSVVMRMDTWSPQLPVAAGMRVWTPSAAGRGASIIRIAVPQKQSGS